MTKIQTRERFADRAAVGVTSAEAYIYCKCGNYISINGATIRVARVNVAQESMDAGWTLGPPHSSQPLCPSCSQKINSNSQIQP